MKSTYKNKMMATGKNKSIRLIPKYIGGVELDFPKYKRRVNYGDLLPEMPIEIAKNRQDFILVKEK